MSDLNDINDSNDVNIKMQWISTSNGVQLYTKTFEPKHSDNLNGLIFFIHGFAEYTDRYNHIFPIFAKNNLKVFSFDQRGFGKTAHEQPNNGFRHLSKPGLTDWNSALNDIQLLMFRFVANNPNIPLFIMGHSMGGGLTLGTLTRNPNLELPSNLKGVISCSPLILLTNPPPKLLIKLVSSIKSIKGMTITPTIDPKDLTKDEEVQKRIQNDILSSQIGTIGGISDMLINGELLVKENYKYYPSNLPLLIVHGDDDKVNAYNGSKLFFEKVMARNKEFKTYKDAYHELFQEIGDVKYQVTNYIIEWVYRVLNDNTNNSSKM